MFTALALVLMLLPTSFVSASSPPLIISAVQTGGTNGRTSDDFIELFNTNAVAVNLNGYRLVKRTSTGTTDTLIKSWTTDTWLAPHGFYLWANSGFTSITPDTATSATISDNNAVALRFGANDTGMLVDAISWGNSANGFINVSSDNPPAGLALVRDSLYGKQAFVFLAHQPRTSASSPVPPEELVVDEVNSEILEVDVTEEQSNTDKPVTEPADILDDDGLVEDTEEGGESDELDEPLPEIESVVDHNNPEVIAEDTAITDANPVEEPVATETTTSDNTSDNVSVPVKIRINELLPNPSGEDAGGEWIELYNGSDEEVNLAGYILDDITASIAVSSNAYVFPDLVIQPKSYLAITIPSGKFTLNNTGGESVTLLNPQKQAVDTVAYTGTVAENQAYAYFADGWLWTAPTKSSLNIKPVNPVQTNDTNTEDLVLNKPEPLNLQLSEIYPSPREGESEFLELYNAGPSGSLLGYKVKIGTRVKGLRDLELRKGDYLILQDEDLPAQLSNTGQTVELISPFGEVIDAVTYPKANIGESLSRFEDNWLWSLTATPDKSNVLLLKKLDVEPFVAPVSSLATTTKQSASKNKSTSTKKAKTANKPATKTTKSKPTSPTTAKTALASSKSPETEPVKPATSSQQPLTKFSWVLLAVISVGGGAYVAYKYALRERWQF